MAKFRYANELVRALLTGNQTSNTVNVWTSINFDNTDDFDTDGMHDPASNNSRITAPITGKYLLTGSLLIDNTNIGSPLVAAIRFIKNGSASTIYGDHSMEWTQVGGTGMSNAAIISLAAGDYVELQGIVTGSSGTWDITDALGANSFAMAYLGE